jgi:hypothetical protein
LPDKENKTTMAKPAKENKDDAGKAALESRRQAAQEHRRCRIQACGDGADLPEIHLRFLLRFYNHLTKCIGYFSKIILNRSQTKILEKLHDTLLPKLMSGEVRVAI